MKERDGALTEHLAPQVDEQFLDVFESRVQGTVGEPSDAADVTEGNRVNPFAQDQPDRRVSNCGVIE
jgi:hypothetical protein